METTLGLKVRIERIPDDEDVFREWCEANDVDCFGNIGRRGWVGWLDTYIRDNDCLVHLVDHDGAFLARYEDLIKDDA